MSMMLLLLRILSILVTHHVLYAFENTWFGLFNFYYRSWRLSMWGFFSKCCIFSAVCLPDVYVLTSLHTLDSWIVMSSLQLITYLSFSLQFENCTRVILNSQLLSICHIHRSISKQVYQHFSRKLTLMPAN